MKKMPSSCLCIIIHTVIESFGLGEKLEIINLFLRTKMFLNLFIMQVFVFICSNEVKGLI